ncbi:hypothetical protein BN1723_006630, partial [Verticillium longisporum]
MASGFGAHGGPSRCFPFWQELLGCYVVNTTEEDGKGKAKCGAALEDYYECLHHKKEAARTRALQAAYRKAATASERDSAPSAGHIRSLGTLGGEESTKSLTEIGTSVATNGGLLEVQAFRSMGRQRQAPRPGEYRDQVDYGITCPSGGLVENPQDLAYYNWDSLKELNLIPWSERHASTDLLFYGAETDASGEVDSTTSDKNGFDFSLSPTQKAVCFDDGDALRDMAIWPKKFLDGTSHQEARASRTLDICEEILPVVAHQHSAASQDISRPVDHYLQRPLQILPPAESHSRKSSGASRALSIASSLLPYIDDYNKVENAEIQVATRVVLGSLRTNAERNTDPGGRPLRQPL